MRSCNSKNNTDTLQKPFSIETLNSQARSNSVSTSDGAGQPLTLADQIERRGCALTAEELSRTLNVSKITVFQTSEGRTYSFISHRYMCPLRPQSRCAMAQKHVKPAVVGEIYNISNDVGRVKVLGFMISSTLFTSAHTHWFPSRG